MFVSSYNIGESLNRKTWGKCMCVCGRTRNPNPPGRGSKLSSERHGINNFCINNFLSSHVTRILDSPNAEAQTAAAPYPQAAKTRRGTTTPDNFVAGEQAMLHRARKPNATPPHHSNFSGGGRAGGETWGFVARSLKPLLEPKRLRERGT